MSNSKIDKLCAFFEKTTHTLGKRDIKKIRVAQSKLEKFNWDVDAAVRDTYQTRNKLEQEIKDQINRKNKDLNLG